MKNMNEKTRCFGRKTVQIGPRNGQTFEFLILCYLHYALQVYVLWDFLKRFSNFRSKHVWMIAKKTSWFRCRCIFLFNQKLFSFKNRLESNQVKHVYSDKETTNNFRLRISHCSPSEGKKFFKLLRNNLQQKTHACKS